MPTFQSATQPNPLFLQLVTIQTPLACPAFHLQMDSPANSICLLFYFKMRKEAHRSFKGWIFLTRVEDGGDWA